MIVPKLNGQQKYSSEKDEFLCISGDTLTFKLSNEDAFGSFCIGKGLLTRQNDKIYIKQVLDLFSNIVSVNSKRELNSIQFSVFEYSGNPMEYVSVKIQDTCNGKVLFERNTNENGNIRLNDVEEKRLTESSAKIILESVGFYAETELSVSSDTHYIFKCQLDYPFTVFNSVKDIEIIQLSPSLVRIRNKKKEKILRIINGKQICGYD